MPLGGGPSGHAMLFDEGAQVAPADFAGSSTPDWRDEVEVLDAADSTGATDVYGLMYTPTTMDSTRRYPIVNRIYPGPQTGSVGSRAFSPAGTSNQTTFFLPPYAFTTAASTTLIITGVMSRPVPSPSMKGMMGSSGTLSDMSALTVIFWPLAGTWMCWYMVENDPD